MRRAALLLAVAAALALAACGDDTLTTAQLRTRATVICARTATATDRIAVPSTPAQGGRFLREGLARLRPAAAQLDALKPPPQLHDRYRRAVQLARREIALIAAHERAIAHGEDVIDAYRRLARRLAPLEREENAYWRGLQVPACVRR
jgi:hypothetical protein